MALYSPALSPVSPASPANPCTHSYWALITPQCTDDCKGLRLAASGSYQTLPTARKPRPAKLPRFTFAHTHISKVGTAIAVPINSIASTLRNSQCGREIPPQPASAVPSPTPPRTQGHRKRSATLRSGGARGTPHPLRRGHAAVVVDDQCLADSAHCGTASLQQPRSSPPVPFAAITPDFVPLPPPSFSSCWIPNCCAQLMHGRSRVPPRHCVTQLPALATVAGG
jgi:hypothetical protein